MLRRQDWWIENLSNVWPLPVTSFTPIEPNTSVYLLDDIDLKGTGVRSVTIFGETQNVTSWSEALDVIVEKIYDRNSNFASMVASDAYTSNFFSHDNSKYYNSAEIYDTGLYVDTGTSTNRKLQLIKALASMFGVGRNDLVAELVVVKNEPSGDDAAL
jgi:hypothetical protein